MTETVINIENDNNIGIREKQMIRNRAKASKYYYKVKTLKPDKYAEMLDKQKRYYANNKDKIKLYNKSQYSKKIKTIDELIL